MTSSPKYSRVKTTSNHDIKHSAVAQGAAVEAVRWKQRLKSRWDHRELQQRIVQLKIHRCCVSADISGLLL
ncbi:hypothetical protein RB195_006486 [Necator americanus]|uniref:Uncharacterized protein n=1 Tax=Necator americanus TaxID=51031 RepID=A0ABR1BWJ5_NECAM